MSIEKIKASPGVEPAPHTAKFRRIVTGHDENGTAIFIEDQICPNRFALRGNPNSVLTELWKMNNTPGNNTEPYEDPATSFTLIPPINGNVLRILEVPPIKDPVMHRTPSVDYAVILKGECYAVMDGGETLMREGDILIQRGTIHAWANRSDKPCLILFVLCGAETIPGLEAK